MTFKLNREVGVEVQIGDALALRWWKLKRISGLPLHLKGGEIEPLFQFL